MPTSSLVDRGGEAAEVELDGLLGEEAEEVVETETLLDEGVPNELLDETVLMVVVDVSGEAAIRVELIEVASNELVDKEEETAEVEVNEVVTSGIGIMPGGGLSGELVSLDEVTLSTVIDVAAEES